MHRCKKIINEDTKRKCGVPQGVGGYEFCDPCYKKNEEAYPQGWSYYPGDICEHGVYTGGCGIDWMCGQCEMA